MFCFVACEGGRGLGLVLVWCKGVWCFRGLCDVAYFLRGLGGQVC